MLKWPGFLRHKVRSLLGLKASPSRKMDIGQGTFPLEILKILSEVSESHFIAFDLEFSGVATRRPAGPGRSSKLSLQEFYEDVKIAAEKYQILQVGLTVVKQDLSKGQYIARPYNFNISPLTSLRERHFGREWSYHSGAIAFLTRNGFKFDLPITSGVQYLSRSEEQIARQNIIDEEDLRSKLADMDPKPEDDILIQHIRSSVRKWQKLPKDTQEPYLNIPAEEPGIPQQLSRYQIRLTHQIIRNEYPNLKTQGMGHFVSVSNPTDDQQASQKLALVEIRERDLAKAIGFRWLVEGLVGGNILGMPEEYVTASLPAVKLDGESHKEFLQNLQQKLKVRPRVMIGHNCFTDFVNFYKCFIGPLPDTVEKFTSEIHDLFPGVVDTKRLASFGHKRWGNTSLEDVEKDLRNEEIPRIHVPAEYDRYTNAAMYHEAGYDSLLTSMIAIKLSAQLEREHEYLDKVEQHGKVEELIEFGAEQDEFHEAASEPIPPEEGAISSIATTIGSSIDKGKTSSNLSSDHQTEPNGKASSDEDATVVAVKEQVPANMKQEIDNIKKKMERTNMYDVLEADEAGPEFGSSSPRSDQGSEPGIDVAKMQQMGEIMPAWDSKVFWTLFGNKLQVNGSKEGFCKVE